MVHDRPSLSGNLTSAWTADVLRGENAPVYPRPRLVRPAWTCLDGDWDYAITPIQQDGFPDTWAGTIRVPFAPEASLSGVGRHLEPDEALWYHRPLRVDAVPGHRTFLRFEAVDYACAVWINGQAVGRHTGGNLPFGFDITDALDPWDQTLIVRVTDATDAAGTYQTHGKQALAPTGIWYTRVSGIWQSVWLESVPAAHIGDLAVTGSPEGDLHLQLTVAGPDAGEVRVRVKAGEHVVAEGAGPPAGLKVRIPDLRPWSPEDPFLYDLDILYGEDRVGSYCGLRRLGMAADASGHRRFTLNGEPFFHWGTLDQGWWPDGLLTPPTDEALLSDIRFLKAAGFNTIRKHIKVEPRRFYYHCDRLGMLVWQDQPSQHRQDDSRPAWVRLNPDPPEATWPEPAHRQFLREVEQLVQHLGSHPCVVQWVPFNEAWGQHATAEVAAHLRALDPTRPVNVASGGNWFPAGDIVDAHAYPDPDFPGLDDPRFVGYVKVVGEFGGHGLRLDDHLWNPDMRNWGYGDLPQTLDEWKERFAASIDRLIDLKQQGIAAGIYTQTTDVEGEINGLLAYDRTEKVDTSWLAEQSRRLLEA
ncbi:MAG: glycoside hydrolase family 2 protein [Opitutales bacterium]